MKKIYAIVRCRKTGVEYAAHIDEMMTRSVKFSDVRPVSKAEYRQARGNGMPSWGETHVHLA